MVRQNIRPNPALKEFEAYLDFSGGLNSEVTNEKLRDNEFPILENVDLSGRGSAKMRPGRSLMLNIGANGQGMFFYYKADQSEPDLILACGGMLFVKTSPTTYSRIMVTDGGADFVFQSTKPIEAVQYRENLFVATGTKLVEVAWTGSAWTAKTITPYTPTVMEAIYIGTNGLAANPDAYVQDGVSTALEVAGIKPASRNAAVNTNTDMVAYINKPASITSVDYKWEYKKASETTWTQGRDWTTGSAGKTWAFNVSATGNYDVRVSARDTATPATVVQYVLSDYTVQPVADKPPLSVSGIQQCRKILLHWDRLIMAGDDTTAYISDLENPRYFPVTNTINFDTGKQEPITAIVRFQDMLVFFTKTTIQTLVGKSVESYARYLIHDGIGCSAGWTAKVVGNVVVFKAQEGFHRLKPNPYRLETMNVDRIDQPVQNEIPSTPDNDNACALVYDSQYWVCFPFEKVLYRYYYEQGIWVKDTSDALNIIQFLQYGETVYNLTKNGVLVKHDNSVYTDFGTTYNLVIESKFYDLSASFNYKKLKRLYILGRHYAQHKVGYFVTVQADSSVVLTPETGQAVVGGDGYVTWQASENANFEYGTGTTFGSWIMGESPWGDIALSVQKASVRGKCRRVKLRIEFRDDNPAEIFGFGFEFKLKKI